MKNIKNLFLPVIFCITGFCVGQQTFFSNIENLINRGEFEDTKKELNRLQNTVASESFNNGKYIYYQALILKRQDSHSIAFKKFLDARNRFEVLDSLYSLAETNFEIYDLLWQNNGLEIDETPYGIKFIKFALSKKNTSSLLKARAHLIKANFDWESPKKALAHYKNSIRQLAIKPYPIKIAAIEMNIASVYKDKTTEFDSSCYYYDKSLHFFKKNGIQSFVDISYNNLAKLYQKKGNYFMAAQYLEKSNNGENVTDYNVKTRAVLYKNQLDLYERSKNNDSILKYALLLNKVRDTIANISQQEAIIKYQTAETEKQRLIEKTEKERSQKTNFILGIVLVLGSIIAFLIYRSTKRKQHIAEQEKELEIQKTTQILKEKEVETINAMVEGQEKERLRLAGELHDNLGSTLATVKMQVENLERNLEKVDDPKGLLHKTNTLINEAYQKVRRISHERNSGVMAKEGLLPAVQKLAKQISSSGQLHIDVQDFGLENRLSNHLEITIFRIIQELTTNIVKHAQASEASISLTQHDNELNIIVEDNGKGFKVGKLEQKDGMGLGSIERRVEHLEGSMEVDSTLGKGTNIIIDIPLETPNDNTQIPNEE